MWPAKRKQPRPRSPACAGKAARLPFPQQKPPFGAVFLWAADGSRLMPPAKEPVCLRLFGRGHRAYEQRHPTALPAARGAPSPPDKPHGTPTGLAGARIARAREPLAPPAHSLPLCCGEAEKTTAARSPGCRRCHAIKERRDSACRSWSIFLFATLRVPNHPACRFTEKRGFSAWFRPGGAVTPPRVFPFFKGKTL